MTLFFYVLKDFLKYVLGTILLAMFLFVMFDVIHKTTKYFSVYQPSTKDIVSFYLYQIPSLLSQAIPIAALLGSVISMVLMSRTNEITAMRAAGMGPFFVGLPVAVGGLALTAGAFFLGEFIVPKTTSRMHYIQQVKIEGEDELQVSGGAKWLRNKDRIFNFKDYDPLSKTMYGFQMLETGLNFRPKWVTEAEVAKYDPLLGAWELMNITKSSFHPNGTLKTRQNYPADMVDIPVNADKLTKDRRKPNELSLSELDARIEAGITSGADVTTYKVDFHVKLAFHFAAFVVSLIGIKFAYQSERTVESAKSILIAFIFGMSYWFMLNSGRAYATQGTIPPIVGAWSANVITLALASLQIWRAQKS